MNTLDVSHDTLNTYRNAVAPPRKNFWDKWFDLFDHKVGTVIAFAAFALFLAYILLWGSPYIPKWLDLLLLIPFVVLYLPSAAATSLRSQPPTWRTFALAD